MEWLIEPEDIDGSSDGLDFNDGEYSQIKEIGSLRDDVLSFQEVAKDLQDGNLLDRGLMAVINEDPDYVNLTQSQMKKTIDDYVQL